MHKELIIKAFEKSRAELEIEGAKDPSMLQMSTHLADVLEKLKTPFGYKSLQEYYKQAKIMESSEDINLSVRVVKGLCDYLGYGTYQEYLLQKEPHSKSSVKRAEKHKKRRWWLTISISISFAILVGTVFYFNTNQPKWMVWKGDHYEEIPFNQNALKRGDLKVYKEERIRNFRKVNRVDCNYKFFNDDGSVRLWYGKNTDKQLEYFTDVGLHPETGKTLKPITDYMIQKYICSSMAH